MTERLTRWIALCAAALSLSLLAPSSYAQEKVLRWGNNGEVSTMDPHGAFSTADASLLGNIYESLVRRDQNLNFQPALATSWQTIAPDHWRFNIRKGVRFHDGTPLTGRDIVASLKRASLPNSPYLSATAMIRDTVLVDDFTVDVLLRGAYPVLLNDLSGVGILSERWMTANNALEPADPAKGRTAYTTLHANGTGPFMLVSRQPDVATILARFPDWWDKPEHNIDRVEYRPIANDATRVAALLSGQIDLITPTPVASIEAIRRDPAMKVVEAQDLRVVFIGFNVAPDHIPDGAKVNPLVNLKVRQALAGAIDVDLLTRQIMRGLTKPIHTLIAPEIQGYDASLATPRTNFDPERSRKLLAEAGYPSGFSIGMDCPNDRFVNSDKVCEAIGAMWAKIGVKISLSTMHYPIYMQKFLNGKSDIFLLGWANTPQIDAYTMLNNVLHTRVDRAGTWNAGRYSNAAFDALTEKVAVEMDAARRQSLIDQAFEIERADFATIPLYREPMVLAMTKNLDIPASPDGKVRLWLARMK
jgi:peptide/nickel transport system substrate-binding protein